MTLQSHKEKVAAEFEEKFLLEFQGNHSIEYYGGLVEQWVKSFLSTSQDSAFRLGLEMVKEAIGKDEDESGFKLHILENPEKVLLGVFAAARNNFRADLRTFIDQALQNDTNL